MSPRPIEWGNETHAYIPVDQVVPGLRILGMFERNGVHEVIKRLEYRGEGSIGSAKQRLHYLVWLRSGKSIPMDGESKLGVLKPLPSDHKIP